MAPRIALLDANVLYPAALRDLLMRLALRDLFRARWSADIHDEWMRSVLINRPDLTRAQLERTRELMDRYAPASIVTDYAALIGGPELPDPDDRHVLAAARRAGADVIVTFNLQDFPPSALEPFGIAAEHRHLLERARRSTRANRHRDHARASFTTDVAAAIGSRLLDTLERQGLPQTVSRLRAVRAFI